MYRSAIQDYKASYFRERSSSSMFDSHDKRKSAAVRIKTKVAQCKSFFKDVAGDIVDFDTVAMIAEVLSFDDVMLSLELGTLCKRYPDMSHEQIFSLLPPREDLAKGEAKQLTSDFMVEGGKSKKKEEFVYYSDKTNDMIILIVDMKGLITFYLR